MRRSRVFIQSSLLISLCAFGTPGYAAEKNANSKRKVAFAPVSVRMPPAAVTTAVPRAASPVEKSKLLNSSYPQSHLQRGYYFKQQGRIDDALLEFIRAAQENPREVRAFREQAEIFKERGNLKLAKSALEQSLAVTPGDSESRSFLVQLQFQSGNLVGAASEVGKLFGINQEKPKVAETKVKAPEVKVKLADSKPRAAESKTRSSDTKSSFYISPPAPGSQNSNVGGVNANAEESSEWLNSAASIVDTSPAVQSAGNFDEVASRLGIANANENKKLEAAAAAKAEAEARARNGGEAPTLASILGGIPAIGTSPAEPAAKPANADAKAPAERSSAENTSAAQSGIFSRVRSSASHAMVMPAWVRNHMPLGKDDASDAAPAAAAAGNKVEKMSKSASVLSWVKDKVPFTQEKQESASVPGDDKQGRMAAAISWMKEKTPFTGHEKAHDDFSNDPGRLASIVKGVRQKLPFVPKPFVMPTPGPVKPPPMVALGREIKQHIPFVKHNADEAAAPPAAPPKQTVTISGSDPNSELPATVSKMLEGKFNGAASVTTAPTPPSLPASTPMSDELKQVLASVSGPSSEGNPYERPDSVKGKYSLLK